MNNTRSQARSGFVRALQSAVGCAASLWLAGCSTRGGAPGAAEALSVDRYYPLRAGSVWTYDVDTGEGLPVLAITRVVARDGNRASVSSGAEPVVYEQRPDGLFRAERGAYLLKAPLIPGAHWDDGEGGQAEVTRSGVSMTTAAGTFNACVEVREANAQAQKEVRTVFCPDVGPVELESTMAMSLTGKSVRVKASLRGYDFSGALAAPAGQP